MVLARSVAVLSSEPIWCRSPCPGLVSFREGAGVVEDSLAHLLPYAQPTPSWPEACLG